MLFAYFNNLVNIAWIEIVGRGMGLKCKNTESEELTLLSVLSCLFGHLWAELGRDFVIVLIVPCQ